MTSHTGKTAPSVYARVAGILYLSLVPLGFFGIMYVPSTLVVPGNAIETSMNIQNAGLVFRLSIVSAFLVQIVNIFLVLVLYKLLKPVNKNHAVLMVIFLLVGVPIAMLNELNNLAVIHLLSGGDYLQGNMVDQMHAQVMFYLDLHRYGVLIAGVFWGLWLFPMGYLVFKSGFLPKILGILLMIGCFGYLMDSFFTILFPSFPEIALFTFWGELLFPLWLLIKGVDVAHWHQREAA